MQQHIYESFKFKSTFKEDSLWRKNLVHVIIIVNRLHPNSISLVYHLESHKTSLMLHMQKITHKQDKFEPVFKLTQVKNLFFIYFPLVFFSIFEMHVSLSWTPSIFLKNLLKSCVRVLLSLKHNLAIFSIMQSCKFLATSSLCPSPQLCCFTFLTEKYILYKAVRRHLLLNMSVCVPNQLFFLKMDFFKTNISS